MYNGILMKILLVSDIHANLPALEAFCQYREKQSLSTIPVYFLGDYVNLGPFPDETVSLLRSLNGAAYLAGNHDRYIVNERALEHNDYFGNPEGVVHCRWTRERLSADNIAWLRGLPVRHQFDEGGFHIDMIHGRHDSDEETLEESGIDAKKSVLYMCGHTHVPRNQSIGNARIFNPGSLGKPLDRDNRASFGIVEIAGGEARFEIVRIPYDIDRTVRTLESRKVPWRAGIMNSLRTAIYTDEE